MHIDRNNKTIYGFDMVFKIPQNPPPYSTNTKKLKNNGHDSHIIEGLTTGHWILDTRFLMDFANKEFRKFL